MSKLYRLRSCLQSGLAQRLNCVVVFLHHVGKAKQEEGQTGQGVHRARGGSAYSGFSQAIFNLLADTQVEERVTLECAKVKGERFEDVALTLDKEARWFFAAGVVVKAPSAYEQVVGVFNGQPLKRAAIQSLLPNFNARTLDRHLKDAVDAGDLAEVARGTYQKAKSRQSGQTYRDVHLSTSPEPTDSPTDSGKLDFADGDEAASEDKALDAIAG